MSPSDLTAWLTMGVGALVGVAATLASVVLANRAGRPLARDTGAFNRPRIEIFLYRQPVSAPSTDVWCLLHPADNHPGLYPFAFQIANAGEAKTVTRTMEVSCLAASSIQEAERLLSAPLLDRVQAHVAGLAWYRRWLVALLPKATRRYHLVQIEPVEQLQHGDSVAYVFGDGDREKTTVRTMSISTLAAAIDRKS